MPSVNHSERAHSPTGFSGAFRWLECTAQPTLFKELEADGELIDSSSPAADRGTLCHEVAEQLVFKQRGSAKQFIGEKELNGIKFDEEMATATDKVVKLARKLKKEYPDYAWSLESKEGGISEWPELWGTADMTGIGNGEVIVIDFKFGNKLVDPSDNPQLILTGLVLAKKNLIDIRMPGKIKGAILQPSVKEPLVVKYSPEQLQHWSDKVDEYFSDKEKVFSPSKDRCHFCPCKHKCEAKAEDMTVKFDSVVEVEPKTETAPTAAPQLSLPAPANVPVENVADIMRFKTMFDKWYKDFLAVWTPKAESGEAIPGTKMVTGRKGTRKWSIEQDQIEFYLRHMLGLPEKDVIERKVITPAKLEKDNPQLIEHLTEKGFIDQEEGKPTFALEDDKRKDYNLAHLFSTVTE